MWPQDVVQPKEWKGRFAMVFWGNVAFLIRSGNEAAGAACPSPTSGLNVSVMPGLQPPSWDPEAVSRGTGHETQRCQPSLLSGGAHGHNHCLCTVLAVFGKEAPLHLNRNTLEPSEAV